MGSLSGHILPGSFFLLFGFWWSWSVFHKYFLSLKEAKKGEGLTRRRKRNSRYTNSVSFRCFACKRIPTEGIIKVATSVIGIVAEYITAYKNGVFTHYGNIQHMTMYLFFGLNGLIEIIDSFGYGLLQDMDYVTGILAFIMEGILFAFHLDASIPMEYRLHVLLVLLITATVISSICEMIYRDSIWAALCRCYFVVLQGTWFYQIGFVLYVYGWKNASNNQMKIVSYIFAWHFAAVFIALLLLGYAIRWKVFKYGQSLPYDALYHAETWEKLEDMQNNRNIELSSSEEL